MKKVIYIIVLVFLFSCSNRPPDFKKLFENPPESSKPWTFWFWRKGAVSKKGITADLEAMKKIDLGGAYLIPVQGPENPPLYDPPALQLTDYWWGLIDFAFKEAHRLGLKIAIHACDGFAVAGGPWITPEISMQKVVWYDTIINGGKKHEFIMPQPESFDNYYEDIATFAVPTFEGSEISTRIVRPFITTSYDTINASFLAYPDGSSQFRSKYPCWIQYKFDKPFTCRTVLIHTKGNNLQAHRLIIEAGNDGINFEHVTQLHPPRHGWQDYDFQVTHAIPPTTAKYFRFYYDPSGTEPGAEDYDMAKFKQSLKIAGIELFGIPKINQYEGKNGSVWRISKPTSITQIPDSLCIPLNHIVDISSFIDKNGYLNWEVPEGDWMILRMGHTSTGHTNYIGGGGLGLECDKFDPAAAKIQFDNWFGNFFKKIDAQISNEVLKMMLIDSWEAGGQNWSVVFRDEFKKRRGYDLYPFLPLMAGVPIENNDVSERFLLDIRETISELVTDNFFKTMADLAHKKGCVLSAESVAPTFTCDGMLHYKKVDIPMGEFWFNSPTHDKPNDMLDAVSAAHIYGKKIIQAESFTTLRMTFSEHPGKLKTLLDRNYALGFNKVVFHVFCHNPWTDKKPGMTLDGVGLYFQRDQIWWNQSKTWIEYMERCQSILQQGVPVTDIAVFTGEEIPRRSLTPDRLIRILPGLFDENIKEKEYNRQINEGIPTEKIALDVSNTVNTFKPENWIDPLNGYKYDCINKDALLNLAKVKNGRIVLPGGASYGVLVIPGNRKMNQQARSMSAEIAKKILYLVKNGATVIMNELPEKSTSLIAAPRNDEIIGDFINIILTHESNNPQNNLKLVRFGKGKIILGTYDHPSLDNINLSQDFYAFNHSGIYQEGIEWNHRKGKGYDTYFISNQDNIKKDVVLSFRVFGKKPFLYHPVTGKILSISNFSASSGRTEIAISFNENESFFIIFQSNQKIADTLKTYIASKYIDTLKGKWIVHFDNKYNGPKGELAFDKLNSWSENTAPLIQYYSGNAIYTTSFNWDSTILNASILFDKIANIATVKLNGIDCGTLWTKPYITDISHALKMGENTLSIEVSNTWLNRLLGDYALKPEERTTWTTAPYRFKNLPLEEGGIIGNIYLIKK